MRKGDILVDRGSSIEVKELEVVIVLEDRVVGVIPIYDEQWGAQRIQWFRIDDLLKTRMIKGEPKTHDI